MDEREHNDSPIPSEDQPIADGETAASLKSAEAAPQADEPAAAKLMESDPPELSAAPPPVSLQ
jgi:hypothetical protein